MAFADRQLFGDGEGVDTPSHPPHSFVLIAFHAFMSALFPMTEHLRQHLDRAPAAVTKSLEKLLKTWLLLSGELTSHFSSCLQCLRRHPPGVYQEETLLS